VNSLSYSGFRYGIFYCFNFILQLSELNQDRIVIRFFFLIWALRTLGWGFATDSIEAFERVLLFFMKSDRMKMILSKGAACEESIID
jgi:hypothetical protein